MNNTSKKMVIRNGVKGFTLFEVLIYIGLFSIILTGTLVGAFNLIDSSARTRTSITLQQEANFIFRKIEWALNGDVDVTVPARGEVGTALTIDGVTFAVNEDNELMAGEAQLTASRVVVEGFFVERSTDIEPDTISFSFMLNGTQFPTSTRFIR